jgi:hypothetical protein
VVVARLEGPVDGCGEERGVSFAWGRVAAQEDVGCAGASVRGKVVDWGWGTKRTRFGAVCR